MLRGPREAFPTKPRSKVRLYGWLSHARGSLTARHRVDHRVCAERASPLPAAAPPAAPAARAPAGPTDQSEDEQ
jgi:hypothetical protein